MRRFACGAAAALLMAAAGCGGGTVSVEGDVTFDGQPVQNGTIGFMPTGEGKKIAGQVVAGKYLIPAEFGPTPGAYKVEIHWRKPTGKKYKSDAGEFDVTEEGLPDKYHDKTELTADVKSGKNVINFNLKK